MGPESDPKPPRVWQLALLPPHTGTGRWSLGLAALAIVFAGANALGSLWWGAPITVTTAPAAALLGGTLAAGLAAGALAWRALRRLGDRSVLLAAPILIGLWAAVALLGLWTDRL